MATGNKTTTSAGLPSPQTLKRSRWLYWGGMAVFVVAAALVSVWVMSHDTVDKIKTLHDQLAAAKPYLLIWRLGLMGVLIGCYPVWANWVANGLRFHPRQKDYALNQRWRVACLVILVELLFDQRGFAVLLHWLFPGL